MNPTVQTEKIQREGPSKAHDHMSHSLAHCRRRGFASSVRACVQALDEKRCVMDGNRAHPELHDEKAQGTLRAGDWSDHGDITRPREQLNHRVATGDRTRYLCEGVLRLYRHALSIEFRTGR